MSMAMRIIIIIMTILQFLFPFFDFDIPEEETTGTVIEETTTAPDGGEESCSHFGGKATCLEKAKCLLCGEYYGELGSHVYNTEVTEATCTEDGYTTYTCNTCGDSYVADTVEAKGHSYVNTTVAPTCFENGYTYHTCSSCGHTYKDEEVLATGHNYIPVSFEPTCEAGGYTVYTCEGCKDTYTENTSSALGHSYTEVITVPTCTEGGYTTYTCDNCGDSYTGDEKAALGHSFVNYLSDNNATCTKDGTKTAKCENGCYLTDTVADVGSMKPHADENKDKHCDVGGEELYMEFSHLTYPEEAVKSAEEWGLSMSLILPRADASEATYTANKGYTDMNGILESPYYTVKVDGVSVPVYAALTYSGELGEGVLHSYSEIYIEKDTYNTFELEINSAELTIENAALLPESLGKTVNVADGKATIILSGYGVYTFMFNDNDQAYTYTLFVREEIDEDAEIAALRAQGYTVTEVSGYLKDWEYTCFSGPATSNNVIYFRKGAYVTAKHMHDISSDELNSSITEDGASANNGIGLNRYPFVSAHNTNNIKLLGYGVLDLTHLDRGERRGVVFSFANNVEVRGIKIVNAPEWSFITYRCDTVTIKNVDVFGYRLNSDAFDICNSKNVTVEGCFARSGDDIFGVKALGGDENAITDNIVFTDCYAWAAKARAFGIFGECNRNISNVTFKDSFVLCHDADWDYDRIPAIGLVIETADANNGAITFDGITFENIEICRNDAAAMNCIIFNGISNFTVKDVLFKNITYKSYNVLNRIVNYGGDGSNNSIAATFEGCTADGINIVDSNKTLFFSEESYWGNYITVK